MYNVHNKFVVGEIPFVDFWLLVLSYARCTFDFYVLRNLALDVSFRASYLLRFAGQNVFLSRVYVYVFFVWLPVHDNDNDDVDSQQQNQPYSVFNVHNFCLLQFCSCLLAISHFGLVDNDLFLRYSLPRIQNFACIFIRCSMHMFQTPISDKTELNKSISVNSERKCWEF